MATDPKNRTARKARSATTSVSAAPVVIAVTTPPTKQTQLIVLLQRDQGATIAELVAALGWLPHTTRAALTGLRKRGHDIIKNRIDDVTRYSIAPAAAS